MKKSFLPVITSTMRALFLGSLPSETSLAQQQYYAHPQNQFWKLLYDIYRSPYETSYSKRLMFLEQHHLGLWDVVASAEREGSLDSAIKKHKVNDFEALLKAYPQLTHFYFTSKQAYAWFYKVYQDRLPICCITLASPSPANARLNYQEKRTDWLKKLGIE